MLGLSVDTFMAETNPYRTAIVDPLVEIAASSCVLPVLMRRAAQGSAVVMGSACVCQVLS